MQPQQQSQQPLQQQPPHQQPQQQQQQIYYPLGGNPVVASYQQQAPQLNGVAPHDEVIQNLQTAQNNNQNLVQQQPQQVSSVVQPVLNAVVDQLTHSAPITDSTTDTTNANATGHVNNIDAATTTVKHEQTNGDLNDNNTANDQYNTVINDHHAGPKVSEPKSFANLFKSDNVNSGMSFASAMSNNANNVRSVNHSQSSNVNASNNSANNSSYASRTANSNYANDNNSSRTDPNGRTLNNRPQQQSRERRSSNANQYNDNNQLFLGNLPINATEDELKVFFGKFGPVVDLRVHSKGPKPGQRITANYGFLTFEDADSAQNCLSNCVSIFIYLFIWNPKFAPACVFLP